MTFGFFSCHICTAVFYTLAGTLVLMLPDLVSFLVTFLIVALCLSMAAHVCLGYRAQVSGL